MGKLNLVAVGITAAGLALLSLGCASQPRVVPTAVETPTESVVVVIVTATTQPTFAATEISEPTITPLATFTPIGANATITSTVAPTPTRQPTTRVVNTAVPARTATSAPAATAAPTKVPAGNKYPAPVGIDPSGDIYHDGNGISFHIASVGPLGSNECYRLDAQLLDQNGNVAGSDYWLLTGTCGNASGLNTRIPFGLPAHAPTGNNYAALARSAEAAAPGQQFTFRWWVTVVQNNGLGPDGVHYNTVALSPPSAPLDDVFVP